MDIDPTPIEAVDMDRDLAPEGPADKFVHTDFFNGAFRLSRLYASYCHLSATLTHFLFRTQPSTRKTSTLRT